MLEERLAMQRVSWRDNDRRVSILVNSGDLIGKAAQISSGSPRNHKLFIKMSDESSNNLNPIYFLNSITRQKDNIAFRNDIDENNKLGIQRILSITPTPDIQKRKMQGLSIHFFGH